MKPSSGQLLASDRCAGNGQLLVHWRPCSTTRWLALQRPLQREVCRQCMQRPLVTMICGTQWAAIRSAELRPTTGRLRAWTEVSHACEPAAASLRVCRVTTRTTESAATKAHFLQKRCKASPPSVGQVMRTAYGCKMMAKLQWGSTLQVLPCTSFSRACVRSHTMHLTGAAAIETADSADQSCPSGRSVKQA